MNGSDPIHALQFLKNDLAYCVGNSGRPVVIFHHVQPDNPSWSSKVWSDYYNIIKNYNVVAIIHGHTHSSGHYTWSGIDVFQDGATQYDPYPGRFMVFRITGNQLSEAVMSYDRTHQTWNWIQYWTKSINTSSSSASLASTE
jgi:cytolysin (calcineurin-like family phosphatase)